MPKLLLLVVAVAGAAAVARKKAASQATASLWREATQDGAPPASRS